MLSWKVIFTILSLYLCNSIINAEQFKVPNNYWEEQICTALNGGYEYNNNVIDVIDVKATDPSIKCWYGCDMTGCKLLLEQPTIYGVKANFIVAIIVLINAYILFPWIFTYKKN